MTTSKTETQTETEGTTNEKETEMTDATPAKKKVTSRKPAAKKATAKKATTRKPRARKARAAAKDMSPAVRALAAQVVGSANEAALANEDLGVKRSTSNELPGNRKGMRARIVLDDGTVIAVTVTARMA